MKQEVLSSPIRWAGSKKKVLNEMFEFFMKEKENYIEPFLGSGVVLINALNNNEELKYKNFYVNDINENIIDFYKMLKNKPKILINSLIEISNKYNNLSIEEKEKMYYDTRKKFNSDKNNRPVYFYFLMKVGFNGVYRENKKGEFNVPFGKKEKFIIQKNDLMKISKLIKNVHFYNLSYDKFFEKLETEKLLSTSFIYCDPPYIPDDNLISKKQELYTNNTFNHKVFVDKINKIEDAKVVISMSESKISKQIYGSYLYQKNLSDIIRTINPKKLFSSKEILFSNFKID